ncbi:AP2 domain transcription factor AP2III-3 [Toxoplasma gondii RUB]|uniref:AP2 domain transcription factor AP2III-3 n=1 Tax=Toxoplasma gondii RUB TaxID=935652 RepID=A0A086LTA0_TOXGO|nr:AP2 domain transcription factor AP2III-3 [Toxoplasma gondii RUB]
MSAAERLRLPDKKENLETGVHASSVGAFAPLEAVTSQVSRGARLFADLLSESVATHASPHKSLCLRRRASRLHRDLLEALLSQAGPQLHSLVLLLLLHPRLQHQYLEGVVGSLFGDLLRLLPLAPELFVSTSLVDFLGRSLERLNHSMASGTSSQSVKHSIRRLLLLLSSEIVSVSHSLNLFVMQLSSNTPSPVSFLFDDLEDDVEEERISQQGSGGDRAVRSVLPSPDATPDAVDRGEEKGDFYVDERRLARPEGGASGADLRRTMEGYLLRMLEDEGQMAGATSSFRAAGATESDKEERRWIAKQMRSAANCRKKHSVLKRVQNLQEALVPVLHAALDGGTSGGERAEDELNFVLASIVDSRTRNQVLDAIKQFQQFHKFKGKT